MDRLPSETQIIKLIISIGKETISFVKLTGDPMVPRKSQIWSLSPTKFGTFTDGAALDTHGTSIVCTFIVWRGSVPPPLQKKLVIQSLSLYRRCCIAFIWPAMESCSKIILGAMGGLEQTVMRWRSKPQTATWAALILRFTSYNSFSRNKFTKIWKNTKIIVQWCFTHLTRVRWVKQRKNAWSVWDDPVREMSESTDSEKYLREHLQNLVYIVRP
jgi:hypothetical protein